MDARMLKLAVAVVGIMAQGAGAEAPPSLQAAFAAGGFESLTYAGVDLLAEGAFSLRGVFFQRPDGDVYAIEPASFGRDGDPGRTVFTFAGGRVVVAATAIVDRVRFTVDVDNEHARDRLVGVYVELGRLRFPEPPSVENRSWLFYTRSTMGHNIGQPGVVGAVFTGGVVAVCNEQVVEPLAAGFGAPPEAAPNELPILLYTGRHPLARERFPFIDRVIRAGGRDRYELSLRLAPPGADLTEVAADLYLRFADAYPFELDWPDRRPIGRAFLSSASQNWQANPRGWHHGFGASRLDIGTEAGRAEFTRDLLRYADRLIEIAGRLDAQGVIVWDLEGQEQPHMISYLGDPRSLPPEMLLPVGEGDAARPVVDVFFERIREAGLLPGLCIRPQRPLRPAYDENVEQIAWIDHRSRVQNVAAKIRYARDRWGCRLFYFDSDVQWSGDPYPIPGAVGHSATTDPDLIRKVSRLFPDVLILPEWQDLRCYAYSAPYSQLNYNRLTAPPAEVLKTYPDAFLVNNVAVAEGHAAREALVAAVKRGDILFYTAWYGAPENDLVREIYEAAGK